MKRSHSPLPETVSLQESEERFRLLVEGVRDYAIFMLDPEGHVISWNDGARRIKGYEPAEIVGSHFSRFYPPDAIGKGWPEHELAVARREGRFEDEGWRLRKDGSRFWANVVITALYDGGQLRGFAKITRDLTERRKIEELELEGRRINEFLAMLGHELRGPLGPIRSAVALLQAKDQQDSVGARACEVIERQVLHLGRIVDDLLDLGRINAGKILVKRELVDFASVVAKAVDSARLLFDGKRQAVEADLPSSPLHVRGDATRLSQVLLNLLINAHKYTPAGGHVWIVLERDGRSIQLRIRDDGIGMSHDLLTRAFDPFVQGERHLDRAEGGLGIGLTLVRKLVELHQGSVSASSNGPGYGSEFVVRLPAAEVQHPEVLPAVETADPTPKRRVLVVDDNPDSAEMLALLLELWGHAVRTASDAPQALAAVAEAAPDLVILDIGLPGMDGYDLAQRLRALPGLEATKLLALTGYGQPADRARALASGFDEHLVKPASKEDLQAAITRLIP